MKSISLHLIAALLLLMSTPVKGAISCEAVLGPSGHPDWIEYQSTHSPKTAWQEAQQLQALFREMPVAARRAHSVEYFAPQVRESMRMAKQVLKDGYEVSSLLQLHPQLAPLKASLEATRKTLEEAQTIGARLIAEKQLTMENVIRFNLSVEMARSMQTRLQRIDQLLREREQASPERQGRIGRSIEIEIQNAATLDREFVRALETMRTDISRGFILFPTFAATPPAVFSRTWPEVRIVGFIRDRRVSFDGRKDELAVEMPIHDLVAHRQDYQPSRQLFDKLFELEALFLKTLQARNPQLLSLGQDVYFMALHEDFSFLGNLAHRLTSDPSISVQQLAQEFRASMEQWLSNQISDPQAFENLKRRLTAAGYRGTAPFKDDMVSVLVSSLEVILARRP